MISRNDSDYVGGSCGTLCWWELWYFMLVGVVVLYVGGSCGTLCLWEWWYSMLVGVVKDRLFGVEAPCCLNLSY